MPSLFKPVCTVDLTRISYKTSPPSLFNLRKAYYCTNCDRPNTKVPPPVELPFHLHVLIDSSYNKKQSTGLQSKILSVEGSCSSYTSVSELPSLPVDRTIVLFPTATAVTLAQIAKLISQPSNKAGDISSTSNTRTLSSVEHVVVLEATWAAAVAMIDNPALKMYTFAKLDESLERKTMFWRHQTFGSGCLSTIECIHQVCLDYELHIGQAREKSKDSPNYDSLLFYFVLGYKRMKAYYSSNSDLIKPTYW